MPSSRVTWAPASTVNSGRSGLITSTPIPPSSPAVTVRGPFTSTRAVAGFSSATRTTIFLRFRRMEARSSWTPFTRLSLADTPGILAHTTAAPGMTDRSTRRSELPTVSAYPFSNGSATIRPKRGPRSSHSIRRGRWNINRGIGPPLLRVQLDDELFLHGDLDVVAERQAAHNRPLVSRRQLHPLGHLAAAGRQVLGHPLLEARVRPELDLVPDLDEERGQRHLAAVHLDVAVADDLPGLGPGGAEAEPEDR